MNIFYRKIVLLVIVLFLPMILLSNDKFDKDTSDVSNYLSDTLRTDDLHAAIDKIESLFSQSSYYEAAQLSQEYLSFIEQNKLGTGTVYTDLLFWYGYSLAHMGYYENSIEQFNKIIEKFGYDKHSYHYSKFCRGMGVVYGLQSDRVNARKFFNECLSIAKVQKDYKTMTGSLANLGILHLQTNKPDSALVYFLEANKIAILHPDECEEERILYLMGAAYCYSDKFQLGTKYLQDALDIANKKGNQSIIQFIQSFMINYMIYKGDYEEAEKLCRKQLEQVHESRAKVLECEVLFRLSSIYGKKKNYMDAYDCLYKSYLLRDSIKNSSYTTINNILRYEDRLKQNQTKESFENIISKKNIVISVLAVLLFVTVLTTVYFYFKDKKNQKEIQIDNNKFASSDNSKAVDEIMENLKVLKQTSLNNNTVKIFQKLEDQINSLYYKKDWNILQYEFEHEHSELFRQLSRFYPSMTNGDRRMCMFICLNLSNKEIASITNRSIRSVETAKFRLKKKFGLSQDDSLNDFICKYYN